MYIKMWWYDAALSNSYIISLFNIVIRNLCEKMEQWVAFYAQIVNMINQSHGKSIVNQSLTSNATPRELSVESSPGLAYFIFFLHIKCTDNDA